MTILFSKGRWVVLIFMGELGRCLKKIDSMALSDLATVTHSSIDQMFYIDSLAMKMRMNESIAALTGE